MIGWAILAGVFYFGLAIIVAVGGAIKDAVQQKRRVRDAWRELERQ